MTKRSGWTSAKRLIADVERQGPLYLGLIKTVDGDDASILFAHGARCGGWVKVPVSSVAEVDLVRLVPCEDHDHPLVRLRLKAPQHAESELFAKLASALMPPLSATHGSALALGPGRRGPGGWCYDNLTGEQYPC